MKDSTMRFLSDKKKSDPLVLFWSSKDVTTFGFASSHLAHHSPPRPPPPLSPPPHDIYNILARKKNSGACVRLAEEQEISLDALTFEQLRDIDPRFEEDVMKVWDYEMSVERKSSIGGTSRARVMEQIEKCIAYAKTL